MRQEKRELNITLLSPLKMATKRNVTVLGTFSLESGIKRVLQPLLDDGFILKEMNGIVGTITLDFVLETVEFCMNNICNKRNIFWYINEKREIFVNSIDYMYGLDSKTINENEQTDKYGLIDIEPTIENIDYANIINFKNVRLIHHSFDSIVSQSSKIYPFMKVNKKIKKGDLITFDNPIIIDEQILRNYIKEDNTQVPSYWSLYLSIQLTDGTYKKYNIGINIEDNLFVKNGSITYSDDDGDEGEIVLQRDNFFSNLITGFKWNFEGDAVINEIQADNALRYTTMRFVYSAEIDALKGIISDSGQIEKMIDFNEKWISMPELIQYARSLIVQNSNVINAIKLKYDIDPKLKVGDVLNIEMPSFYSSGKFAVKDIQHNYINEINQTWIINLKSADLVSSYIDLFRPAEQQNSNTAVDTMVLSEFVEENITERFEIMITEG